MSNIYIRDGETFTPMDANAVTILHDLPIGIYTIIETYRGFQIIKTNNFNLPSKIYGDVKQIANRVLTTYKDRPNNTGVLLTGTAGSGKTMLAKYISCLGTKDDIITIIINSSLNGEEFNKLIQSIDQPAIIIFDEFEKVYEDYEQEKMLTLFDGVYSSKKLFIITCNDENKIDEHMLNRPGRMYYKIEFANLTDAFIKDYCEDCLKNKSEIDAVINFVSKQTEFSFDMLQTLIEEMNRYEETVEEAVKLLNIN